MLLPLYLRREPTTDAVTLAHNAGAGRFDVVGYADAACTIRKVRWPWFASAKPTRRNRRVIFNCWPWAAHWVEV